MSCCWGDINADNKLLWPQNYLQLENTILDMELEIYNPQNDDLEYKRMSDHRWKRVVLLFYPADFTFVCPTELKDLNNKKDELLNLWVEAMTVSTDTSFSLKKCIETEKLLEGFSLPMISDRNQKLSKLLWVLNHDTGNAERWTFIISSEWVIKSIEIVTEPIWRSSTEMLRKIKALDYVRQNPGIACPASRDGDGKTLKPSIKMSWNVAIKLQSFFIICFIK